MTSKVVGVPSHEEIRDISDALLAFERRVTDEHPVGGQGAVPYARHARRNMARARRDPRIRRMIQG